MASLTTPMEIATAFIEGRRPVARLASLKIDEPIVGAYDRVRRELQSYGPHWPVIIDYTDSTPFWLNVTKGTHWNSATTNRHMRAAEAALNTAGYKPTGTTKYIGELLFAEYMLAQG